MNLALYDPDEDFIEISASHDRLNRKLNGPRKTSKRPVLADYEQLQEKMNNIPKFMSLKKYQLQYQKKKAEL